MQEHLRWWRYALIPLDEGPHHPYQLITKNTTIWGKREIKMILKEHFYYTWKSLHYSPNERTPNYYNMRELPNQELPTSLDTKSLTFQSLHTLNLDLPELTHLESFTFQIFPSFLRSAHMPFLNRHLPPKLLQLSFNKHLIPTKIQLSTQQILNVLFIHNLLEFHLNNLHNLTQYSQPSRIPPMYLDKWNDNYFYFFAYATYAPQK